MASIEAPPIPIESHLEPEESSRPLSSPPRLSHAAYLTAAQLSRGLVRLLFVIITARVLGPQTFGVYALLFAVVEMLAVASGTGHTDYLTREAAIDEYKGWGLASQLIWLRLACTIPLIGLGLWALRLLHYPEPVIAAAAWYSATLIARSVSEAVQGVLRGTGRYLEYLSVELACALGLIIGTVFLVIRAGGLRAAISAELFAASLAAVASGYFAIRFKKSQTVSIPLWELVKASSIFNLYAFVGNLYDRVDVLLLSRLAGDFATGIYSAAYRPLSAVQLLPYGVLYSILPSLSQSKCRRSELLRLEKAIGLLLCGAFLVVLATLAFADVAIATILGARFAETAFALKILIWAVIFRYVNYAFNVGLLAVRRERVFVTTSVVCFIVNVVGNVLLIPIYSWRAAAVLTIVTELVLLGQNLLWIRRVVGTIPFPRAAFSTSITFLVLAMVVVVGNYFRVSLLVGTAMVLLFIAYLLARGLANGLTSVWNMES